MLQVLSFRGTRTKTCCECNRSGVQVEQRHVASVIVQGYAWSRTCFECNRSGVQVEQRSVASVIGQKTCCDFNRSGVQVEQRRAHVNEMKINYNKMKSNYLSIKMKQKLDTTVHTVIILVCYHIHN